MLYLLPEVPARANWPLCVNPDNTEKKLLCVQLANITVYCATLERPDTQQTEGFAGVSFSF